MALIVWYQRAMHGRPSPCRFTPSCSAYALEAFHTHGTFRGGILTIRRLLRCRPFGSSGFDPVPDRADQGDRADNHPSGHHHRTDSTRTAEHV